MKKSKYFKIRVSTPVQASDKIRQILGESGAGIQGNYKLCSNSYKQIGRFKPIKGANPAIGEINKLEEVEEEMIEVICHKDIIENVIKELKKVHPYEEPAIDIIARYEI